MAKQTTVRFVDDLDGSEAVGTVDFGFDRKNYEIDLSEANREGLEKALEPFIAVARRASGGSGRQRVAAPVAARTGRGSKKNEEIRNWARERGLTVSDRGRIASTVIDAYLAEHGSAE